MSMPGRIYPEPAAAPGSLSMPGGIISGYNSNSELLTNAADNFTIELWVKPTETHQIDIEGYWFNQYGGTSGQKYVIDPAHAMYFGNSTDESGAGVSVGTNGVSVYEHSGGYMPPMLVWQGNVTEWTHVAVVYENKTPRLYINGELVRTGVTSPKIHVYPGTLLASGSYGSMAGQVDEVRIWKVVRTQQQIQDGMYHSVSSPQPNLEAYWPIQPDETTTVEDQSGNNHNVTLPTANYASSNNTAPVGTDGYRYGFNGMEKDNEVKGDGLLYTTEYRAFDPRLGRWFSVDPKSKLQPWGSPYVGMNNSPVWRNDPKGDLAPIVIWALKKLGDVAIGVMTDLAVQLAAEKYFGNNGEGHVTWESAWNNLDIDAWQAMQSGGENLVKNKHLAAVISAGGDMLNYYFREDDATWEGAFMRGGLGAVSSYIGGSISSFLTKYGPKAVMKGLSAMGVSSQMLKELKPCGCFSDSTLVLTKEGYKEISKIIKGDSVWSFNDSTKIGDWNKVQFVFENQWNELVTLYSNGQKIETTNEHPFYVNKRWVKAESLKVGDTLTSNELKYYIIDSISLRVGDFLVYNLLVDNFHTFYVSENAVLVHNGPPCPITFQKIAGMFGADWKSKKIHADVILGKLKTEISFRLSADGKGIVPQLVFNNLKEKEAKQVLEYGELFLQNPENKAKLLELSKKALTTEHITDADKIELNKMIEILEPPKTQ